MGGGGTRGVCLPCVWEGGVGGGGDAAGRGRGRGRGGANPGWGPAAGQGRAAAFVWNCIATHPEEPMLQGRPCGEMPHWFTQFQPVQEETTRVGCPLKNHAFTASFMEVPARAHTGWAMMPADKRRTARGGTERAKLAQHAEGARRPRSAADRSPAR